MEQVQELFRQIAVGRIGVEELQGLLVIPCNVSAPITATVNIVNLRDAVRESPLAHRGAWMADKDGNVTVVFRVATLPRRRRGSYSETAVREVLEAKGLRLPTVEEFLVCVADEQGKWLGDRCTPCEDGSCIPSHETEHSVRYLAIEALD